MQDTEKTAVGGRMSGSGITRRQVLASGVTITTALIEDCERLMLDKKRTAPIDQ